MPFERVRGRIGKGDDELMEAFLSPEEVERPGEEIEAWRGEKRKRIGLGTSGKPDELEHHKKLLGIEDLDFVASTANDADLSKPHPDVVRTVLDKLGVAPGEAAMVGDTPHDAVITAKAGTPTVGVLCGGWPEDELRRAGCTAVFLDPADLLARYDESLLVRR